MAERDADLAYGRTLPRLLREHGLVDVAADAYFPITAPACTTLERATVEQIRDRLVGAGIATAPRSTSTSPTSPPARFPTSRPHP